MHGPDEVSFTVDLFDRVEQALGLPRNTIKVGIMDEERRTTVNLAECINRAASEWSSSTPAFWIAPAMKFTLAWRRAPSRPRAHEAERWITAYEDWNVDVGLACGLQGKAQIGKGMWAMPDSHGRYARPKNRSSPVRR